MRLLPKSSGALGRVVTVLLLVILFGCGAIASPVGIPAPWGEILSNYALYCVGALSCALGVLLLFRRRFSALFAVIYAGNAIGLILNFSVPLAPFFLHSPGPAAPKSGAPVGILSADVEGLEAAASEVLKIIAIRKPSIVAVSGVTEQIARELSATGLPVVASVPRTDGSGILLLSSLAVVGDISTAIGSPYEELPPVIQTSLRLPDGRQMRVVALRAPYPGSKADANAAEIVIRRVFVPLRHESGPYLVLGNLNGTPSSGYYGRAWWATGMKNAMAGYGYQASCCGRSWWNRLPVNHILHNGQFEVSGFEVLPRASGEISPVWGVLR